MLYELGKYDVALPGAPPKDLTKARVIRWCDTQILCVDHDISVPLEQASTQLDNLEFIGLLNDKPYFVQVLQSQSECQQGDWITLRDVTYLSETAFMLCARARGLLEWRSQHRYCGQCGQPAIRLKNEPAMVCQPCRLRYYPRISPCIIVLISRGQELLLGLGERNKHKGSYSTLAGFIETGESAEQAVMREVYEEVGIRVKNIQYQNSQVWPFPNQLMLGFTAEYDDGEITPAKGEIADAGWFSVDNLPKHPPTTSIAGWLIRQFTERVKNGS